MSIANSFPFFEADQVLTNKHLNDLFNYLDGQERLTRCKLLGSGIVCGLDISGAPGIINITKGCGLTSQGWLMMLCDHTGANGYKYFTPFVKPPFPADLEIISQCGDPILTGIPFYASAGTVAAGGSDDIQLLLTQTDYDALTDKSHATALSAATNLADYAVVLFLDVDELKLKNCDTNDCNDKGSVMEFDVKVLLVNKKYTGVNGTKGEGGKLNYAPQQLRRYNVPVSNLNSSDDVLNAFVTLLQSDSILDSLASDLTYCFFNYKSLLSGISSNPFGTGADFKAALEQIRTSRPVLLQYYYDFIYDLIKAVHEFRYKANSIVGECCGDEMAFPFHLTLGEASSDSVQTRSAYRQYFIYSPLFDEQGQGAGELRSLLMRLILMYQGFLLSVKSIRKGLPQDIKITPSTYGRTFLSERCIPYYYKTVHDNTDPIAGDLYNYWSFDKTSRGNAKRNLTYDPSVYTTVNSVLNPLYYDIERYNFFRIEGHIGQQVDKALPDLIGQKQRLNLPFEVVALSADYIGAFLRGQDPVCIIQDLESDYRILIAEFICQLHDTVCTASREKYIVSNLGFAVGPLAGKLTATAAKKVTKTAAASKTKTEPLAETAATGVFEKASFVVDHPFISGLVNEFQATNVYTKGDILSRLCAPAAGTVGSYYISSMKANAGKFVNPAVNDATHSALFQFIDGAESLFQLLMTEDLPVIDSAEFKSRYLVFERATNNLKNILVGLIGSVEKEGNLTASETNYYLDFLLTNAQTVLQTCIVEKLEALRNEYLRRVAQYRLAKNFNYYFKKHGGIEHKAGVPRSGTFILVYHEERKNRFIDPKSLFVNQELSQALLSNFRQLLQPGVSLDTQESKAKLLAVSTLYKDPELYLRFRNVMQEYLDDCSSLPPDKKNQITTVINQPPASPVYSLNDGEIIADFYVPYMCCSDCLPIAYILPEATTPDPLKVSQSDPVCDAAGKNYTVTLLVSGGTPPYSYTVNNLTSTSNLVTLTTGSPDTVVTVKDNAAQNVSTTILSHSCQQPCNLPCNGLAENCKYVLWIPKPKDALKDAFKHSTQKALLTLTDEGGTITTIDLLDIFQGMIDKAKITEKIFDALLSKMFDAVNSRLKTTAPQFIGNNQPVFTYDAASPDKFQNQTLDIEKFTCHNVQLELVANIISTTDDRINYVVFATYDNTGVYLRIQSTLQNFELTVPKFGCAGIDKCANSAPVSKCKDKLSIREINFTRLASAANEFSFITVPGTPSFDKYFWYFHVGNPIHSSSASPTVSALTTNPLFVRVLGINSATGCYAILEQNLTLAQ